MKSLGRLPAFVFGRLIMVSVPGFSTIFLKDSPSDQVQWFNTKASLLRDASLRNPEDSWRIPLLAGAQECQQVQSDQSVTSITIHCPWAADFADSMFAPCFVGWNSDGFQLSFLVLKLELCIRRLTLSRIVLEDMTFAIWMSPKSGLPLPKKELHVSHRFTMFPPFRMMV